MATLSLLLTSSGTPKSEPRLARHSYVLIWLLEADSKIGEATRQRIDTALAVDCVFVSAITFWESAMLQRRGRITLHGPIRRWRQAVMNLGIGEIPVSGDIGIEATAIDDMHSDPADRLIAATAMLSGATLVTADRRLLHWRGELARHDARV